VRPIKGKLKKIEEVQESKLRNAEIIRNNRVKSKFTAIPMKMISLYDPVSNNGNDRYVAKQQVKEDGKRNFLSVYIRLRSVLVYNRRSGTTRKYASSGRMVRVTTVTELW